MELGIIGTTMTKWSIPEEWIQKTVNWGNFQGEVSWSESHRQREHFTNDNRSNIQRCCFVFQVLLKTSTQPKAGRCRGTLTPVHIIYIYARVKKLNGNCLKRPIHLISLPGSEVQIISCPGQEIFLIHGAMTRMDIFWSRIRFAVHSESEGLRSTKPFNNAPVRKLFDQAFEKASGMHWKRSRRSAH